MKLWPDSLVSRTVFVLVAGVILSNATAFLIYYGERANALASVRGQQIAEQVSAAVELLAELPPGERRRAIRSLRRPALRFFWTDQPAAERDGGGWRVRVLRRVFEAELGDEKASGLRLAIRSEWSPGMLQGSLPGDDGADAGERERHRPRWLQQGADDRGDRVILLGALPLADGSWLNFAAPFLIPPSFWKTPFFLIILTTTGLVLVVSLWAVRRAARPWSAFAAAAERLGLDLQAPPMPEAGPAEVRRAAHAFNGMQDRLRRFVRDRTQMLAAMSHDLRTPLTRLRLRAELIEDEIEQRKMFADLDEMQAMIAETLAFARDDAAEERAQAVDLAALVQTVCEEAQDAGAEVRYLGPPHAAGIGRAAALKRAFANLVDNAVRYGDTARVELSVAADGVAVRIDDDGPGIPAAEIERVFQPFYRLDVSRSRETGGVGLGLALVRSTVALHGGRVWLENRADGGLRANVFLPRVTAFAA